MKGILGSFLQKTAIKRGHFKLSSGGESDVLVDLSHGLRTYTGQMLLTESLGDIFRAFPNFDSVGGPLCGSDLVSCAIVRSGIIRRWFGVRPKSKKRGFDTERITGALEKGDKVLLVDDVLTTGTNALNAAGDIQEFGAHVIQVFCVVDRGGLKPLCSKLGVPGEALFTLKDSTLI